MESQETAAAIETVFRMELPVLLARLTRMTGDLSTAEELAQDALVAALEQWPADGVPRNAGAWLTTVAKRRAVDLFRRRERQARLHDAVGHDLEARGGAVVPGADPAVLAGETIDDDVLSLVFTACHPVLPVAGRTALTLRVLGGLTTAEIARAHLVPEATIAQRIVRAKKTLADARVPFAVPGPQEWPERLSSVLEVIYLVFNEGYAATAGEDWMRPALCQEALRLGRVLVGLLPREPEAHALLALMELQASRTAARTSPTGEPVLLLDQDRTRWDRLLVHRGLAGLARAAELGGADRPYALQAAIAACHARAARAEDTDWTHLVRCYDALAAVAPSPVVALNRAVAVAMAEGPRAGLDAVDAVAGAAALRGHHLLPSVRGDLLARLGRHEEAAAEFRSAAALTANAREQALLADRARRAQDAAAAG